MFYIKLNRLRKHVFEINKEVEWILVLPTVPAVTPLQGVAGTIRNPFGVCDAFGKHCDLL